MAAFIAWLVTALVLALLTAFTAYLISLGTLPTGDRPRTNTYDRFGALLGREENPDYHENPGELAEPQRGDTSDAEP